MPLLSRAQCTTSNATDCQCLDISQTNCEMLPDVTVSWYAVQTYQGGPNEYPQTGAGTSVTSQGPDDGRLRLSGSTPNIGVGPFEVRGVDQSGYRWFLCGTDTVSLYDPNAALTFVCPNGNPNPHQLLVQRIYHKNGATMTYTEHRTGTMTYHPTHNHYHVDDWEIMTLRIQNPNDPNPLNWPIVGTGNKVGFCLEDFDDCSTVNGHCRDSANNILVNSSFHNFDLGGGNYVCSPVRQGISVGHTDIYYEGLDGQWINIPPHTCNGQYYIVIQVDPHNYFNESNENNNVIAVPFTLTMQSPAGNPVIDITANRSPVLCPGDSITLTATAGDHFLWSTGDSTQSIKVAASTHYYSVLVNNYCGSGVGGYSVTEMQRPADPVATSDTVCGAGSATMTGSGTGTLNWYDTNNHLMGTGAVFHTPNITTTTTFYVDNSITHPDTVFGTPHDKNMNGGAYSTTTQYLIFNAESNFDLLSVKTYAQTNGNRNIQLLDSTGAVLQTVTVNIPAGESRVTLNFHVPAGIKYRLACNANADLYRNTGAGVSFPYGVPGTFKIIGATGGTVSSYFYFYDWKVATNANSCPSNRVAVEAVVEICTGVHENNYFKNSIDVYPNPASENVTVTFDIPKRGSVNVEVKNLVGQTVYSKLMDSIDSKNKFTIDTRLFGSGVYILKMDYEGISYYKKIVIE